MTDAAAVGIDVGVGVGVAVVAIVVVLKRWIWYHWLPMDARISYRFESCDQFHTTCQAYAKQLVTLARAFPLNIIKRETDQIIPIKLVHFLSWFLSALQSFKKLLIKIKVSTSLSFVVSTGLEYAWILLDLESMHYLAYLQQQYLTSHLSLQFWH